MAKSTSKQLRSIVSNPATSHRVVQAWLITKKQEVINSHAKPQASSKESLTASQGSKKP